MTTLTHEQLNIKFIKFWPEAGGDLYQDNITGSSFVVMPDEKLADKLAEVRAKFREGK
jgi:hypothetical protein